MASNKKMNKKKAMLKVKKKVLLKAQPSKNTAKKVVAKKAKVKKTLAPKSIAKKTVIKKAIIKKSSKKTKTSKASKPATKKLISKKVLLKKTKKVLAKKPVNKRLAVKKTVKLAKPLKKDLVKKAPLKKELKPVLKAKALKPTNKKTDTSVIKQVKKCKKSLCKEPAFANGYCRYHYVASWKAEHIDKRVKKVKYLEKLIAEIKRRFPVQYLELIKGDLESDKIFKQVLKDMDIEEEINDFEISDDTQKIINSYSSLVDADENEEF